MKSKLRVSRDEEKICLLSNYLDRQTDIVATEVLYAIKGISKGSFDPRKIACKKSRAPTEEIRKIRNYDRQTGLPTDRKTDMRVHKEVPLPIRNVSRKITQPR